MFAGRLDQAPARLRRDGGEGSEEGSLDLEKARRRARGSGGVRLQVTWTICSSALHRHVWKIQRESPFLADGAAQEAANRVSLPAGRLHQLLKCDCASRKLHRSLD